MLCEYKIRGFRLMQLLKLLRALVLPTSDAWLDWAVLIKWYLQGDVHWAEVGLTILLISGALPGLVLASTLTNKLLTNNPPDQRRGAPRAESAGPRCG